MYPQQPPPERGRGWLIVAIVAGLIGVLLLGSIGGAYALGLFGPSKGGQTALQPTATTAPQPTATPTAKATPSPTATASPTPTATTTPAFRITSVSAAVSPGTWNYSCGASSASQSFTFTATIHVNSNPNNRTVTYYWQRSDGATATPITVTVPPSSTSIAAQGNGWTLFAGVPNGTYWERIVVTAPNSITSNKATFTITCT